MGQGAGLGEHALRRVGQGAGLGEHALRGGWGRGRGWVSMH